MIFELLILLKSESSVINLLLSCREIPAIKISFSFIKFPEFLNILNISADPDAEFLSGYTIFIFSMNSPGNLFFLYEYFNNSYSEM